MMKLIIGTKGSGKTKTMVEMINSATKTATGNVVVIEKSMKLTYDIDHAARLIDVDAYNISGADMLYGFIAGILAGNYDITDMYIDGILKILGHDMAALADVLDRVNAIAGDSLNVTVTVSAEVAELPDGVRKYM